MIFEMLVLTRGQRVVGYATSRIRFMFRWYIFVENLSQIYYGVISDYNISYTEQSNRRKISLIKFFKETIYYTKK